jgi:hypothetical protein
VSQPIPGQRSEAEERMLAIAERLALQLRVIDDAPGALETAAVAEAVVAKVEATEEARRREAIASTRARELARATAERIVAHETRTLTEAGVKLCADVREEYMLLLMFLAEIFGLPACAASEFPRSLLTTFLITRAPQIHTDPRLTLDVSVKKAPTPEGSPHKNLYEHWKAAGFSLGEMMQRLAADVSLFGEQPVATGLMGAQNFIMSGYPDSRLVVTFDHEPMISLYAAERKLIPTSELGLDECQAMIFFLGKDPGEDDRPMKVIGVQKFTPTATLERKK